MIDIETLRRKFIISRQQLPHGQQYTMTLDEAIGHGLELIAEVERLRESTSVASYSFAEGHYVEEEQ